MGSLRGTFANLTPRTKTLVTRWKRGVYRVSQRPETAPMQDSRGTVVRRYSFSQLVEGGMTDHAEASRDLARLLRLRHLSTSSLIDRMLYVNGRRHDRQRSETRTASHGLRHRAPGLGCGHTGLSSRSAASARARSIFCRVVCGAGPSGVRSSVTW